MTQILPRASAGEPPGSTISGGPIPGYNLRIRLTAPRLLELITKRLSIIVLT